MATARRSATLNVMIEAAEKAGRSLVKDFGEVENLQVSRKGPGNFVSTADLKAEKIIRAALEKARPKFGFIMEEGGKVKGEDPAYCWIIDPLDGTSNYLHGLPHWSVAIALEKDKEIIAGVIYDPLRDEMFWAEKGIGAYMNNKRMEVAGRKSLKDTLIGIAMSTQADVKYYDELAAQGVNTRELGGTCLDLAYVAAGRLDAAFKLEHKGGPWDFAAGSLIVKEARGVVTDLAGGKNFVHGKTILAANAAVHAELLKRLKPAEGRAKAS
jgi:myo-inositol-1(or 4)-monophosphatase